MSSERISPTAWLVAYQRTLSDIPLSSEIFHELDALVRQTRSAPEIDGVDALKSSPLAVMWEARFKVVNHVLQACQARQVLEIAAGFSPRGLNLTGDASVTYVEVDLPGLIQDKRRIVETLMAQAKIPARPNFHLAEGNALNLDDLRSATRYFADQPLAVIHEGLLAYLDHAQRAALASNVHALLEHFGGVWITPDIDVPLPAGALGQAAGTLKDRMGQIEALTGVDVLKNRFENEEAARAFFEGLGFQVAQHSFLEIADQLVSRAQHPLAQEAIERGVVFVMTLPDRP